jgi:choline-sulfatase
LRDVAQARREGNQDPFCLTVGFLLPHPPYVAWREDYARFDGRFRRRRMHSRRVPRTHGSVVAREPRARRGRCRDRTTRATAYFALVYRLDA